MVFISIKHLNINIEKLFSLYLKQIKYNGNIFCSTNLEQEILKEMRDGKIKGKITEYQGNLLEIREIQNNKYSLNFSYNGLIFIKKTRINKQKNLFKKLFFS